jgi:hypothetical protein
MQYTVTYTEAEDMAMQSVTVSVDSWIQNICHQRSKQAMDTIINNSINKFLDAGIPIPSTREEIVLTVFANGWEKTGLAKNTELLANTYYMTPPPRKVANT